MADDDLHMSERRAQSPKTPEQSKILKLYGLFIACLLLSILPSIWAALLSFVLFFIVLIAAYVMRTDEPKHSLTANHMTFLIRTIWIGSLIGFITIMIGIFYFLSFVDHTMLDPCIARLSDIFRIIELPPIDEQTPIGELMKIINDVMIAEQEKIMPVFKVCIKDYINGNLVVFIIASSIMIVPILIYMIMRIIRGIRHALKGLRLADPKRWN